MYLNSACVIVHIPVPANPQSTADLALSIKASAGFMEGVSVFLYNFKFVQFKVLFTGVLYTIRGIGTRGAGSLQVHLLIYAQCMYTWIILIKLNIYCIYTCDS